ncbi:MAG: hypothetical protein IKM85_00580 [Bacteroidales bacterium]|nr:hypothetical protein [Bacteroidales bacterium]
MASLEEQIKRLREMKTILDVFQMRLTNRMNDVENMLNELVRMSFPIEIADKYRYRYLYDDKAIVEELAKSIRIEQFDYIDKKIQKLIETSEIN